MPLPKAPTKPATVLTSIPLEPAREPPHRRASASSGGAADTGRARAAGTSAVVDPAELRRRGSRWSNPNRSPERAQRRSRDRPVRRGCSCSIPTCCCTIPTSLFRFEEHDVFLPMMTLEELDSHKKGMSEVARSARQVSRTLDSLVAATKTPIEEGIPLSALGNKDAAGRLIFQTQAVDGHAAGQLARRQGR